MCGVKMKRSRKSELLIGVMIGIYGNWIIAIVEKLEKRPPFSILLFAISFIPFILHFQEIFTEIEKQTWVKSISFKNFLGATYLAIVFLSLYSCGMFVSDPLLFLTGIVLWVTLMTVERRALA